MEKKINTNFLFLSRSLTIKNSHLNKSDVRNIKYSLLHKISFVSLVTAVLVLLINLISLITMGIDTGWNQIEVYGLPSVLGQIVSIAGTTSVIVFGLMALFCKSTNLKNNFAHISNVLVFLVMSAYFFLSFYADVKQGFLSATPTLSPVVALVPFFLMIQSAFWIEAAILDGCFSLGIVGISIYFSAQYAMQGIMYYILVAVFYPIASYVIISILFYAETQRYCEELRSETLHNTANYDELTHCKNRRALKQKIEDNSRKVDGSDNSILVIMFDIDDFKLYNDQFSHIGGDYCLRAIADSVKKAFPSLSLDLYRYGGEEFLLILDVEDEEQARIEIEKVRKAVEGLNLTAAKGAPCDFVTISVGGAFVKEDDALDLNDLIKNADKCLYKAKANGKNVSVLNDEIIPH